MSRVPAPTMFPLRAAQVTLALLAACEFLDSDTAPTALISAIDDGGWSITATGTALAHARRCGLVIHAGKRLWAPVDAAWRLQPILENVARNRNGERP